MQVLTVEHVNREPAENPPGVSAKLGPAPTEFDVAEIRPSAPDAKEDFKMNNGRIQARAVLLRDFRFGPRTGPGTERLLRLVEDHQQWG